MGNVADLSGYKCIYDARVDRVKKEQAGWTDYNMSVTDDEKRAALLSVKQIEREWLPYMMKAQNVIKDDEPEFESFERAIYVLSGVASADRPTGQIYKSLWRNVEKFKKGNTFNGRTFGTMEFKSMTHYHGFIESVKFNAAYVLPILIEAGIEL